MLTEHPCLSLVDSNDQVPVISFPFTTTTRARNNVDVLRRLREDQAVREVRLCDVIITEATTRTITPLTFANRFLAWHRNILSLSFVHCTIESFGLTLISTIATKPIAQLEFHRCHFSVLAGRGLRSVLISKTTHQLTFDSCTFGNGVAKIIAGGLEQNQSLRCFSYYKNEGVDMELISSAIYVMILQSQAMETVDVDLPVIQHKPHPLLQAMRKGHSIHFLRIRCGGSSKIDLKTTKSIMRTFCGPANTGSMKELDFTNGKFDRPTFLNLLQILSGQPIVHTLTLPTHLNAIDCSCPEITRQIANLNVQRLVLAHRRLASMAVIREIARRSRHIQDLHLLDHSAASFNEFCELLRDLPWPTELILDPSLNSNAAPKWNDCNYFLLGRRKRPGLTSITFRNMVQLDLVQLAHRLPQLSGLCKLTICQYQEFIIPANFIAALAENVKENRVLCSLTLEGLSPNVRHDAVVCQYFDKIRYALAKNRVGHLRLIEQQDSVHASLWAHVLARTTFDPDGIFFIMREMPDIVAGAVAATRVNQKMKRVRRAPNRARSSYRLR